MTETSVKITAPPATFVEAEERLAQALPGYESRSQQQALAAAVESSIATRTHLLAEAGTGTGKSLGYLIPAILSGQRTVVSTATRALQQQLADKDLPFLAQHLGADFTYTVLKGRSNYLCVNKVRSLDPGDVPAVTRVLARVEQAEADGVAFHGERDDLGFEVSDREWMQMAAETEDCETFDCKNLGAAGCYAQRARLRAATAQVVVVNHALYLADAVIRMKTQGNASMVGDHAVVIFDEAHEIEEYAGSALGTSFTEGSIRGFATEVRNFGHRFAPDREADLATAAAGVVTAMADLWRVLEPGRIRQATLLEHGDEFVEMANSLVEAMEVLTSRGLLESCPGHKIEQARISKERLYRRGANLTAAFQSVITSSFEEMVRWVEVSREKTILRCAPIDVAPFLRRAIFAEGPTAVLASATLSVGGKFDYIAGRLGIDLYTSIDVGTPFDYQRQSVLYVPTSLPDPSRERAAWSNMAIQEMLDLVKASQGRALLLFTSITEMKAAYESLSRRLPYTCLMQGQKPVKVLAEEFMADTHSVLFATRSFMTGVDFQGEACSLVVVNKMPFPVPTEPLTEARCDAIKARGGSDFSEYVVPVMTLVLKQAFGRLIRHRADMGCVAILDPRLKTKGYGRGIIKSLPDAPLITDLSQVEEFFRQIETSGE